MSGRALGVLAALLVIYLAGLGWITLGPQPLDDNTTGILQRVLDGIRQIPGAGWITYGVVEFSANIVLFVPLGLLLVPLLGPDRWWFALVLGAVLSLTIEFLQVFLPTRVSDPRDLVANTAGAFVGALVCVLLRRRRARPVTRT